MESEVQLDFVSVLSRGGPLLSLVLANYSTRHHMQGAGGNAYRFVTATKRL